MSNTSTRKTKQHVQFNESVQVTTIQHLDNTNTSYCAWYHAKDFSRFREERRREIEAIKDNVGTTDSFSCRGIEQSICQSACLRIISRSMFVRKVLDQQDYENMKTDADSQREDRLATKVCRWSMASVDQAIMRAHLDVENRHARLQDHMLVDDLQVPCRRCSASIEMARDHSLPLQLSIVTHCSCSEEIASKPEIAPAMFQSSREIICMNRKANQSFSLRKNLRAAKCA